jgi:hypothetical protein
VKNYSFDLFQLRETLDKLKIKIYGKAPNANYNTGHPYRRRAFLAKEAYRKKLFWRPEMFCE